MERRARPLVVLALVLACGGEAPPAADAGLDAARPVDASVDARAPDAAAPPSDASAPTDAAPAPGLSCVGPIAPPPPPPTECTNPAPSGCAPGDAAPFFHLRFERAAGIRDEAGLHPLTVPAGRDPFAAGGAVGDHLALRPEDDARIYARWTDFAATTFTLELFVRWTPDTHRYADIRILRMIGRWELSLSREGYRFAGVDFPLDGSDVAGVPYHLDGRWHHLAVTVDGAAGTIALAVDGRRPAAWTKAGRVATGSGAGLYFGYLDEAARQGTLLDLDEVALFDRVLPDTLIAEHARDGLAGRTYARVDRCEPVPCAPVIDDPTLDPREFHEGWVEGDWRAPAGDALEQLATYPRPRFREGHTMPRVHGLWVDPTYLGGRFERAPGATTTRFTYEEVQANATALTIALARDFHQSLTLHDTAGPALGAFANAHPEPPIAASSFWSPSLAAPERVGSAASPALDPSRFTRDGAASRARLTSRLGAASITRGLDVVTENGETPVDAMHLVREADLASNAAAQADWLARRAAFGGVVRDYMSDREAAYQRAYRDGLLGAGTPLERALFVYYNVDGHPTYGPTWTSARTVPSPHADGRVRAMTSFYPRKPAWWYVGAGAWHGWSWIEASRPAEIDAGDALFWPIVAAGWAFHEERNLRPAQWLALLEALSVAGAESYFPAYFVIPGCGGEFGGATDCDCDPARDPDCVNVVQNRAAYAWQAVLPSYAQAVASRYEDVLRGGAWDRTARTYDPAALGVVRRAGDSLVVAVSTHGLDNGASSRAWASRPVDVRVDLDGDASTLEHLVLPARRQGAVYRLDLGGPTPTLVQLDAWHEDAHPSRWSADLAFEVEDADAHVARAGHALTVRTERPSGAAAYDFSTFTSLLGSSPADGARFERGAGPSARVGFTTTEVRSDALWIRARTRGASGVVRASLDGGPAVEVGCVRTGDWAWVRLDCAAGAAAGFVDVPPGAHTLELAPSNADLEVDAVRLVASDACIADALDCGGCG